MWRVVGCMLTVGCGPIISEQPVEGEEAAEGTTTASVASTGSPSDESSEGGEVSGAVDFDLGGASVDPTSCEPAGACDDCVTWDVDVEGEQRETMSSPALAPDGTIVTLGTRGWDADAGGGSIVVARHDPSGERLWEIVPDLGDGERSGMSLAVADDGRIALTGFYRTEVGYGSFVASLTADGAVAWIDEADTFELTDVDFVEGDIVVVGGLHRDDGGRDGMVRRYDHTGALVWERVGDAFGGRPSVFFGIAVSPTNDLVITGATDDAVLSDVWLGRMSATGDVLWSTAYDGDDTTDQWGSDVALMLDGDIIVVGVEHEGDVNNLGNGLSWAGRFSPDGAARWTRSYPGTGCCANGLGFVRVDANGRIFAAGIRGGENGGTRLKIQELDCDGGIAWQWEPEGAASLDSGLAVSDGLFATANDWDFRAGRLIRLDP